MAILTHGSDLSLSPTLTPLVRSMGGKVRKAVEHAAAAGFNAIQLDATLAGIRPRELDGRARKDLLALLARRGARPTGIDLFIPRQHYTDPQHVDRAMTATLAAIGLAADLGKLPLSLAIPVNKMPDELKTVLIETADSRGIRLAIHAEDQLDALIAWITTVDLPALGAAIDPAALLARGKNPVDIAQQLGSKLTVARLSDVERGSSPDEDEPAGEAVRCPVGSGDLDVLAYRVAADLASNRAGPVVLDLRGLVNPLQSAAAAKKQWDDAAFEF